MRRLGLVAAVSLALLAMFAPGVDARSHHGSNTRHHHNGALGVTAHTSHVVQGGKLHIQAKVKHAPRGAAFSAHAVVHFHSGDVSVNLRQRGRSTVALGAVSVAANETPGVVPVTVTVDLNNSEQEVETDATVGDNPDDNNDDGDQTCDPATTTCDDGDANDDGDQTCDPATTTCDDGDANDNGGDQTCDPATTTCNDDGDNNNGGDDQGGDNGGDGGDGGD